jgi:hypothetical protein
VNVYHDDNHEHVRPFDKVVFTWQPWLSVTSYNLPRINASTPIVTFVGFQNHPNININLVPINSKMEQFTYSISCSFITLTEDCIINQFPYYICNLLNLEQHPQLLDKESNIHKAPPALSNQYITTKCGCNSTSQTSCRRKPMCWNSYCHHVEHLFNCCPFVDDKRR